MQGSGIVLYYRGLVFALAAAYSIYMFVIADHSAFGWQFRFLTVWALTLNTVVAFLMLQVARGKSDKTLNTLNSSAVVLNGFVVFMYWSLFFKDPSLVNGDNEPKWYLEYYLHGIGPFLQMFDAFFLIGGAFARTRSILSTISLIVICYILWVEVLVGPLNDTPVGTHSQGLPYPFMNDMTQPDRMAFYGQVIVTMLFIFCAGWIFARVIDRFMPPVEE